MLLFFHTFLAWAEAAELGALGVAVSDVRTAFSAGSLSGLLWRFVPLAWVLVGGFHRMWHVRSRSFSARVCEVSAPGLEDCACLARRSGGTRADRSIVSSAAQLHAAPDAAPLVAASRALYFSECGSAPVSSGPLGDERMADNITYEGFLRDVGGIIRERAFEAKGKREQSRAGSEERWLHTGQTIAFSEVLSILQQTLSGFDLPLESMQLGELDPDRDLL